MKKLLVVALIGLSVASSANASETKMCHVKICNKLERFTLSIGSMISDAMGETCFDTELPQSQAIEGRELSSESRWYQGSSINPTKRSVTRVKEVYECK